MFNASVLDRPTADLLPIWPWWLGSDAGSRLDAGKTSFEESVAARFTIPAAKSVPLEELPTYARVVDALFADTLEPTTGESAVQDIMGVQSRSGGCVILIVNVATTEGPSWLFIRLSSRGEDWHLADFAFGADADFYAASNLPHFDGAAA
ncbi:MAG: hypothetical protein AAFP97_07250 [Pseudomonadota bacterium]